MVYGFIGLGNMASAIIKGMKNSGNFEDDVICGYNRSFDKTRILSDSFGLSACESEIDVAEKSDVIILSVKPQMLDAVIEKIVPYVTCSKTVITIAAGKRIDYYSSYFGNEIGIIRIMPNMNASIGKSVTALCPSANASERQIEIARSIFATVGTVHIIEEKLFSAFTALCSSGGAFITMFIDAASDAGVQAGIPRPLAVALVSEMVSGTAGLISESGEHPCAVQNKICSPGGTTIEGVLKLKELGFESAIQKALRAIMDKDNSMSM